MPGSWYLGSAVSSARTRSKSRNQRPISELKTFSQERKTWFRGLTQLRPTPPIARIESKIQQGTWTGQALDLHRTTSIGQACNSFRNRSLPESHSRDLSEPRGPGKAKSPNGGLHSARVAEVNSVFEERRIFPKNSSRPRRMKKLTP